MKKFLLVAACVCTLFKGFSQTKDSSIIAKDTTQQPDLLSMVDDTPHKKKKYLLLLPLNLPEI